MNLMSYEFDLGDIGCVEGTVSYDADGVLKRAFVELRTAAGAFVTWDITEKLSSFVREGIEIVIYEERLRRSERAADYHYDAWRDDQLERAK